MKHLKLFEAFNSKFDPYQEVSQDEFDNWCRNHNPKSFKKSDTLAILDIIESLWNKKSLDINFYKDSHKIDTPVRTHFRNDQICDVEDHIFTREEFNRIEAYDEYHYFQIEKWEDEWYTAYYDTYGGGHPHYFIVDTEQGIDWLQDKMSTIYSDVYDNGIDESKEDPEIEVDDEVKRYESIIDDVSDELVTEMANWNFIECTYNDFILDTQMYEHPEKDFVFRVRLGSFAFGVENSICVDVVYNTELWANSTGKTAPRLIHDFFKFSRKCVQKLGLSVRPLTRDMSQYDIFFNSINHFHTRGELRFYMGFDDEGTRKVVESNMPQKFEADDDEMALIKWNRFKEEHAQIEFNQSQRNQIQNLLDKSKFSHRWYSGLNGGPEALQIVYNKWTDHEIPQWKDGFNKYVVDITAREDEWFLISQVNNTYGYTDIYLADQFDQVIEFIKSLDPDTDIDQF